MARRSTTSRPGCEACPRTCVNQRCASTTIVGSALSYHILRLVQRVPSAAVVVVARTAGRSTGSRASVHRLAGAGARRRAAVRVQDTSEESGAAAATLLTPLHVNRRPSPLLRQLAALRRRPRECGRHGQEGPHLPLVRAPRNRHAPWRLLARCEPALLTATAASSWHPAT
jgi:hypothetical protein